MSPEDEVDRPVLLRLIDFAPCHDVDDPRATREGVSVVSLGCRTYLATRKSCGESRLGP
jgi:hypothetical protein